MSFDFKTNQLNDDNNKVSYDDNDLTNIIVNGSRLSDQYYNLLNNNLKSSGLTNPNKQQIMNEAVKNLKDLKSELYTLIKDEELLDEDEKPNEDDIAKKAKEQFESLENNVKNDQDLTRLANLKLISTKQTPKDVINILNKSLLKRPIEEMMSINSNDNDNPLKKNKNYDYDMYLNWNNKSQQEKDNFYFNILSPEDLEKVIENYTKRTGLTDKTKIRSQDFLIDDIKFLYANLPENKETIFDKINNKNNSVIDNIDETYPIIQEELKNNEKLNKAFNKYLIINNISNPSNGDLVKQYNMFIIDYNKDTLFKNFYDNEDTKQSLDDYKKAHESLPLLNDNSSTISSISTNSGMTDNSSTSTNFTFGSTSTDKTPFSDFNNSSMMDDDTSYSQSTQDIINFNSENFGTHTDINDLLIDNDDYENSVQKRLIKFVESLDSFTINIGNQINSVNQTKNNYNKFTKPQYNRLRNYIQAIHIIGNDLINNNHTINFNIDTNYHPINNSYTIQNYEEKSKYYHQLLPDCETLEEVAITPIKIMLGACINMVTLLNGMLYQINNNSTDLFKEKKEKIIKRKELYEQIVKVLSYLPIHN